MSYLSNLDSGILRFIHSNLDNSIFDVIMPFFSNIGNLGTVWIIIAIVLLTQKKYKYVGFTMLIALILTSILGEGIIKNVIQRNRPFLENGDITLLIKAPSSYSFPSGHTSSAFAAAGVLSVYFKKYRVYFWVLASLIAFSRMYLYVHYPSDILGGIALGLLCCKIALSINKRFFPVENIEAA